MILFGPGDRPTCMHDCIPGSIVHICSIDGLVRLVVRRYLPYAGFSEGQLDPFTQYCDFPAKTFSPVLDEAVTIIPLEHIECHFAQFLFSDKLIVCALTDLW